MESDNLDALFRTADNQTMSLIALGQTIKNLSVVMAERFSHLSLLCNLTLLIAKAGDSCFTYYCIDLL